MAQSKKTVPAVDATDKATITDNGQVDSVPAVPAVDTKDTNKQLVAILKSAGIDTKGLFTEYCDDPDSVTDTLAFLVKKNAKNAKLGITQATMDAALAMFGAMKTANAPKIKAVKEIPTELAESWKLAYDTKQQFYAEKTAAYAAFDKVWNDKQAESKSAITAARAVVESAGFFVKGDSVVATKSGSSSTNGEHGNAGTTKLSIGWIDINIGGVEYDSWKSAVQTLEPGMIVATSTNYLANTQFANKCAEKGLPISVSIKLALKGHTAEDALKAWNTLADDGKFASGAHRKLAEVGASITIA